METSKFIKWLYADEMYINLIFCDMYPLLCGQTQNRFVIFF